VPLLDGRLILKNALRGFDSAHIFGAASATRLFFYMDKFALKHWLPSPEPRRFTTGWGGVRLPSREHIRLTSHTTARL
jgi:hypothetical protein